MAIHGLNDYITILGHNLTNYYTLFFITYTSKWYAFRMLRY